MAKKIQIAGVVKARQQVEELLERGDEEADGRARKLALDVVQQVEAILRDRRIGAEALPTPTRKAHAFLAAIATGADRLEAVLASETLPRADAGPTGDRRGPRAATIRKKARELGRTMWKRRDDLLRDRGLMRELDGQIRALLREFGDGDRGGSGASLLVDSFAGWLRLLLDGDHLRMAVKALDRAERAARDSLPAGARSPEIIWMPIADETVIVDPGPPRAILVSVEYFNAPKRVWKAVIRRALDPDDLEAGAELDEFLDSTACRQYVDKILEGTAAETDEALATGVREPAAAGARQPAGPPSSAFIAERAARAIDALRAARPLPRDTWVGGIIRLPMWFADGDERVRMHGVMILDRRSGAAHSGPSGSRADLSADHLIAALGDLARGAGTFGGGRPGRLVINDAECARRLREALQALGVDVVHEERPAEFRPLIDHLTAAARRERGGPDLPDPLSPKGMTLAHIRAFADAAHAFHAAPPWRHLCDEDAIEFEPDILGMRWLRVTGNAGIEQGLLVTPEETPDPGGNSIMLTFDLAPDTPPQEQDFFDDEGLPVHDGRYPNLLRIEGRRLRRLSPENLAKVEGLMRALVASDPDEIDTGRWRKTVSTACGEIEFGFTIAALCDEGSWRERGPSPGFHGLSDRQHRAISRLAEKAGSIDEVNEMLRRSLGNLDDLGAAESDEERALDLMHEARSAPGRLRLKLARRALELDPGCPPAHGAMGRFIIDVDPEAALPHFERAVSFARSRLGDEDIDEHMGSLWAFHPARTYLLARRDVADCLLRLGRFEAAREHFEELLAFTTRDNQGIRYELAGCLLRLEDHAALEALIARFPKDISCLFDWARALARFQEHGDAPGALKSLRQAMARNRHVADAILHPFRPAADLPGWQPGAETEAGMISGILHPAWQATRGARAWLARNS